MQVRLAYGKEGLWVDLPDDNVTLVEPRFVPGLLNEMETIRSALREPIGTPPLRELVKPDDTVAIVFSDVTRPQPRKRMLPVLLEELSHLRPKSIFLVNALGTHRPNTDEEIDGMLGREIRESYRIVQHNARDTDSMVHLGPTSRGHEVYINGAYMEADVKILTGVIEPHFFAGFSGGPKAVLPGLADQRSVLGNHDTEMISHPKATWCVTQGNPIWEEMREVAAKTEPSFLLNVTLNKNQEITGVFAGDVLEAFAAGTAFASESVMVPVSHSFDVVITTNSGYPLDLSLYQAVKGISAAALVVREGGSIIAAADCLEGIPDHGQYKNILKMADSPQQLLEIIKAPGFLMQDQWQAQVQAQIQLKADVYVKASHLSDEQIREALLLPCHSISESVTRIQNSYGEQATICVLPEGPQTVPYVRQ